MPITSPAQLVDEFKKSGEFDRLRRELLIQFQQSDGFATFKSKTEDIARQRLTSDNTLRYMPPETVQRELMQELDRYPIVERAVADLRQFSDPSFSDNIRQTLQKVVDEDNKTTGSSSKKQEINGINSKSTNNSKPRRLQAQRGAPRHPPAGIQRNLARDRAFLENSSRLAEHAASDKNDTVITEAGGSANNGSNTNATKNLNLDTPESSTTVTTGSGVSAPSSNSSTELPSTDPSKTTTTNPAVAVSSVTNRDGSVLERRRGSDVEMKDVSLPSKT